MLVVPEGEDLLGFRPSLLWGFGRYEPNRHSIAATLVFCVRSVTNHDVPMGFGGFGGWVGGWCGGGHDGFFFSLWFLVVVFFVSLYG